MAPLDSDVQSELNSASAGYYKPHKTLAIGASEEIGLVRYAKHLETKYPIKDSKGNSLGYTWRFWLTTGQVWDVSNSNRKVLLQGLHPRGQEALVPGRFRITNLGRAAERQPGLKVEYLGVLDAPAEPSETEVPF